MSELIPRPDFSKSKNYFSRRDAMIFNERVLKRWKPSHEVWPFIHGDDLLGSLAALGSFYITHYFRKELKLRPYARTSCYVPVVAISAFGSYIFQTGFVTYDILKTDSCPLCIHTKSALGQLAFGIAYPLTVASIICFQLADKISTYPVPPLLKAPKEVFFLFSRLVQKNPRPFLVIGAIHMLSASFITFQKQSCYIKLKLDAKDVKRGE